MIAKHKSGQAALIIVIVTMVTALGIAVSSTTQSRIHLRDTVYSTQSEQALGCSEAGAEQALANISNKNSASFSGSLDNCSYDVKISDYPCNGGGMDGLCDGTVTIPNLADNAVQEISVTGNSEDVNIKFKPLKSVAEAPKRSLAIYLYKNDSVERLMVHCSAQGSSKPSNDFESVSAGSDDVCTRTVNVKNIIALRLRPLYSNMSITLEGNGLDKTGQLIVSTGTAGSVQRKVVLYRYYEQLPSAFDEAVISFDESNPLD